MVITFIIVCKNRVVNKYLFNNQKKIIIGSAKRGIDIILDDEDVDKRHCEIYQSENKWYIKNISETKEIFLNDISIPPSSSAELSKMDHIVLGNSSITIDTLEEERKNLPIEQKRDSQQNYPQQDFVDVIRYAHLLPQYNSRKDVKYSPLFNISAMLIIFFIALYLLLRFLEYYNVSFNINYTTPYRYSSPQLIREEYVKRVESIFLCLEKSVEGKLSPFYNKIYKVDIDAKIEKIYKKEGSQVKKGNILFSLNQKSISNNKKIVKTKKKLLNISLKKIKKEYKKMTKELKKLNKTLQRVEKELIDTKNSPISVNIYSSNQGTLNRTPISLKEREERAKKRKEEKIENLTKQKKELEDKISSLQIKINNKKFKLDEKELEIEDIKLSLALIKKRLKKLKIYAEHSGIVKKIYVKEGDNVKKESKIMKIIDKSKMVVKMDIDKEYKNSYISKGSQISLNILDKNYIGTIKDISLKDENLFYRVEIEIDNRNLLLDSNMSATINIKESECKKRLIVPKTSVSDEKYVYVVENNIYHKVHIKILKRIRDNYVIESEELNDGDTIILEVDKLLRDRGKIKILSYK